MVTRGVPCLRRATSLAYTDADEDAERLLTFGDSAAAGNEADEWVETHAGRRANADSAANPGFISDIPDLDGPHEDDGISSAAANLSLSETPDLDDIPDMEEELEDGDDAAAAPSKPPPPPRKEEEVTNANLLSVRTYDVMITYDKYYQTPRIWLLGYDEASKICQYGKLPAQVTSRHDTERNPTSARSDIPRRNGGARIQDCYDRGIPPFYLSPGCVCASMQARERDAEAHRTHECRCRGRAEITAQSRVKGQQEKVAVQARKRRNG
jgi:hypothetical protein